MRNVFNKLLVVLCMVDLLVIMTNLIVAGKTIFPHSSVLQVLTPWSDGLCHVAISASVFMTITITVERYYAVSSPYSYQIRIMKKGYCWILSCYIIPVIFGAVILNIPKMLQIGNLLSTIPEEYIQISINAGIIYQVFHPFATTCIIPIVVLSVLNYKIVMASKQRLSTSNKLFSEIKMAKTMMTIVIVFIILNIPKMSLSLYEVSTIPNIIECNERQCPYQISSKRWLLDSIIRYMVMLNSSINFIIYCFVGSNFRSTLVQLVQKNE